VDEETADQATVDHVIPRGKGGTNEESNLRSSCRDCNGRRNHEDMCGFAEGFLLGKNWKGFKKGPNAPAAARGRGYVVLSGDEKKVMARMDKARHISNENVLREQRDQGLKQIAILQKELSDCKTALNKLQSMSIATLVRIRLAKWLLKDKNGNDSQSN